MFICTITCIYEQNTDPIRQESFPASTYLYVSFTNCARIPFRFCTYWYAWGINTHKIFTCCTWMNRYLLTAFTCMHARMDLMLDIYLYISHVFWRIHLYFARIVRMGTFIRTQTGTYIQNVRTPYACSCGPVRIADKFLYLYSWKIPTNMLSTCTSMYVFVVFTYNTYCRYNPIHNINLCAYTYKNGIRANTYKNYEQKYGPQNTSNHTYIIHASIE